MQLLIFCCGHLTPNFFCFLLQPIPKKKEAARKVDLNVPTEVTTDEPFELPGIELGGEPKGIDPVVSASECNQSPPPAATKRSPSQKSPPQDARTATRLKIDRLSKDKTDGSIWFACRSWEESKSRGKKNSAPPKNAEKIASPVEAVYMDYPTIVVKFLSRESTRKWVPEAVAQMKRVSGSVIQGTEITFHFKMRKDLEELLDRENDGKEKREAAAAEAATQAVSQVSASFACTLNFDHHWLQSQISSIAPVSVLFPHQKELVCTETYHEDFGRNYIKETLPSACEKPWRLFGKMCVGADTEGKKCSKIFVSKRKGMDVNTQFCPSALCPIHYCNQLGKDGSTCAVAYCHDCYCARLNKCGLTPDSPRKKRRVDRPISYSL